jgi:hypothetical protein
MNAALVAPAGAGKSTMAAMARKNPAGMTSNPAIFMRFPFFGVDCHGPNPGWVRTVGWFFEVDSKVFMNS